MLWWLMLSASHVDLRRVQMGAVCQTCVPCIWAHMLTHSHHEDAAPIDVDWNQVKAALLSDHAIVPVVPSVPAAGDRELPPKVKFHKGQRTYFAICDEVNVKAGFRVKDLGDEAAFASAVDAATKLRVGPSVAIEENPAFFVIDAKCTP